MMNEQMVRNLIGEDDYMTLLIGLPDQFFKLPKRTQDALWYVILININDGIRDIDELITMGKTWIKIYERIKTAVHSFGYGIS